MFIYNQSINVLHLEEEEQFHTLYSVLLMCQWLLKYSHDSFTNTRSVLARPKEFEGAEWPTRSAWLLTRGKVGGGSANACMQEQATLQQVEWNSQDKYICRVETILAPLVSK